MCDPVLDAPTNSIGDAASGSRVNCRVIAVALLVFAALSVAAAVTSVGFLEADSLTHYFSARFAFVELHRFVSIWDRPLFILLYSAPAALGGVLGARLMSLALAIACALLTLAIARRQKCRWPELALVCLLAQPLLFLHSFSEMTELPFAVIVGVAMLAYQKRWWGLMTLAVAFSPLSRPEGFGLLLLAGAALVLHRRIAWIVLLPLPLILWSSAGWMLSGRPAYGWGAMDCVRWLSANWPYSGISVYDAGPLLFTRARPGGGSPTVSFLLRLPAVISPLLFPFMVWGVCLCLGKSRAFFRDHAARCQVIFAALPLAVLAGHSILWWRGLMASSGELRYLLVVAPMWAMLTAIGVEWAFVRIQRLPWLFVTVAALVPVAYNIYYPVVPFGIYDDDLLAKDVAAWYRGDPQLQHRYPRVAASYIALYKELDISTLDCARATAWKRDTVRQRRQDTLLVWDEIFGDHNADTELCIPREMLLANGWIPLRRFSRNQRTWEVFVAKPPGPRD
jgi:hypothetical protein